MYMPFGRIEEKVLSIDFSSADFSVASVLNAIREHLDMLQQMEVIFLGISTDVPAGPSPVFRPVPISAVFEYTGKEPPAHVLERAYQVVWQGLVNTFPTEADWAAAKHDYAQFISAQADLLRARVESETGSEQG
ncbi:MAG: hypothetical protein GXP25_06120 [Planctomycetes bacterium]|nr:hypothetical protein [Planctomycetota bacterium]